MSAGGPTIIQEAAMKSAAVSVVFVGCCVFFGMMFQSDSQATATTLWALSVSPVLFVGLLVGIFIGLELAKD